MTENASIMEHNDSPSSIRINPTTVVNGPEEHLLDEIRQVIGSKINVLPNLLAHYFYNDYVPCQIKYSSSFLWRCNQKSIYNILCNCEDPDTPGCWIPIVRRWLSSKTSNVTGKKLGKNLQRKYIRLSFRAIYSIP